MANKVDPIHPAPPKPTTAVVPLKSVVACLACKGEYFTAAQRYIGDTRTISEATSVLTCVTCSTVYGMTYGHDGARLERRGSLMDSITATVKTLFAKK